MKDSPCTLRRATRADAPALLQLVCALAEFERLDPPDESAQLRLTDELDAARPRLESWLAFFEGRTEPVGYAMLVETYSSFLARPTLYLEDVFVLPEFRGHGIGTTFLRHCIALADERQCGRMEWTCLDWNTRAQAFYEDKLGARHLREWRLYRLTREGMEKYLATSGPGKSA